MHNQKSSHRDDLFFAPVVLFVYSRPEHTKKTINYLLKNPEANKTDLIVFSDAARTKQIEPLVNQVREYISETKGFKSVTLHLRPYNFGLSKSIIEGVTQTLSEYESVIVLEDDMITSPYFLSYMNNGLKRFAYNDRVISIHGYVYPVHESLPNAFFLCGADCWGWATWRRGWALFNPDGHFLLNELKRKNLVGSFDFNGAYRYSKMLKAQIKGQNDSWAIRWYASAFLANKLTLYPGRSLVHNIGNDSSGTHCGTSKELDSELSKYPIPLDDLTIEESTQAKKVIEEFLRGQQLSIQRMIRNFLLEKIRNRLNNVVKDWIPPVLARQLRRLSRLEAITFEGPYAAWDKAASLSSGYDGEQILERVLTSTLLVKRGEALFERDSVIFDEVQYSWPVTAGLMWVAARNGGRLSVLDFGGSLGSSYFQNRQFLAKLPIVRWSVIEQAHFVEAGLNHIQDEQLVFYPTITECVVVEKPNVVLLSSVLQYLEDPYTVLDELARCGVNLIIIDRTIVNKSQSDMIFLQNVPKTIYEASYPVRSLSESQLLTRLDLAGFGLVVNFPSLHFPELDKIDASFRGYLFKKKSK